MLYNLLGNALKFTDQGQVLVILERSSQGLALRVADTGPGIRHELQPTLFEAFVRDPEAGQPGIGLGLYISARLAALMGARLALDSAPGQGTRIDLWLPWQPAEAPAAEEEDEAAALLQACGCCWWKTWR